MWKEWILDSFSNIQNSFQIYMNDMIHGWSKMNYGYRHTNFGYPWVIIHLWTSWNDFILDIEKYVMIVILIFTVDLVNRDAHTQKHEHDLLMCTQSIIVYIGYCIQMAVHLLGSIYKPPLSETMGWASSFTLIEGFSKIHSGNKSHDMRFRDIKVQYEVHAVHDGNLFHNVGLRQILANVRRATILSIQFNGILRSWTMSIVFCFSSTNKGFLESPLFKYSLWYYMNICS